MPPEQRGVTEGKGSREARASPAWPGMEVRPGSQRGCNQWIHHQAQSFPANGPRRTTKSLSQRLPGDKTQASHPSHPGPAGPGRGAIRGTFSGKQQRRGFTGRESVTEGAREGRRGAPFPRNLLRATPLLISCTRGAGGLIGGCAVNGPPTRNPHVWRQNCMAKSPSPLALVFCFGADHTDDTNCTKPTNSPASPAAALLEPVAQEGHVSQTGNCVCASVQTRRRRAGDEAKGAPVC